MKKLVTTTKLLNQHQGNFGVCISEQSREFYLKWRDSVRTDPALRASIKSVLQEIGFCADEEGIATVSQRIVSEHTGLTRSTVNQLCKEALQTG